MWLTGPQFPYLLAKQVQQGVVNIPKPLKWGFPFLWTCFPSCECLVIPGRGRESSRWLHFCSWLAALIDHSPLTCPPAELEAKQQMTQHESLRINRVVITNFSVKSAVDSFLTFIISGEPSHHRPGVPGNEPDAQSLEWLVQGQASVGDTGLPSWLTPYPLLFPLCHKDNLPQKLQSLKTQFMSPEEEARNPSICFWQLHVLKALKKSCQFRKFKLQCLPGKTGLVFKRK